MFCVRFEILGRRNITGFFQFVQAFFQARQFIHAPRRHVQNRFVAVRFGFLREMTDHRPFIAQHFAGVGFQLFENDGK